MTGEATKAGELFGGKLTVPSELRTAEWAMTEQWLRERSFFMAGVTRAEILDKFREEGAAIVEGASSEAESLRRIEDYLDDLDYRAEPGDEGTIKDLRTSRRILVSLRTNVSLVQGWAQKEKGLRKVMLRAFPAWELVRFERRNEERRWKERWVAAGGVLIEGRMIALKTDDIWRRLGNDFRDSLGVDYPPFAWSSGMGWKQIGRREAIELGVLDADAPDQVSPPVGSPNASLQLKPKIEDVEVRDALAEEMKGLAKWEDEKLVFTDPNGTRTYPAEELVKVWDEELPEVFSELPGAGQMQREAVKKWVEDHDEFLQEDLTKAPPAGLNAVEDLRRAFGRIEPITDGEPLYRGLTFKTEKGGEAFESLGAFLEDLEEAGIYFPNPMRPAESWTRGERLAEAYAGFEKFSVILKVTGHRTARDVSAIVRSLGAAEGQDVVFPKGAKFRVLNIERNAAGARVTVEELP